MRDLNLNQFAVFERDGGPEADASLVADELDKHQQFADLIRQVRARAEQRDRNFRAERKSSNLQPEKSERALLDLRS